MNDKKAALRRAREEYARLLVSYQQEKGPCRNEEPSKDVASALEIMEDSDLWLVIGQRPLSMGANTSCVASAITGPYLEIAESAEAPISSVLAQACSYAVLRGLRVLAELFEQYEGGKEGMFLLSCSKLLDILSDQVELEPFPETSATDA